jgi:hypothetical protein
MKTTVIVQKMNQDKRAFTGEFAKKCSTNLTCLDSQIDARMYLNYILYNPHHLVNTELHFMHSHITEYTLNFILFTSVLLSGL